MLSRSNFFRFQTLFRRSPILPSVPTPPASRAPLIVGLLLAVWLNYYLYGSSLSLPFLQEDSSHIRWLSGLNPIDPFFTAKGAPDYRPLGKSIIKLWYLVLGYHDPVWLRFHNIVLNALNAALVAVLAVWLDRSYRRYLFGGMTALIFASLPFAYQAVPWINNFFYPLGTFLLLLMTAVYWQARLRNSNRLLALALLLCFIAPFQIEYGLMGGALLFLVELLLWLQKRQAYPWLGGPLLGLLMNLAFLVRSLTIPKEPYYFGPPTLDRVKLIATYFLQGLMHPLSRLAVPMVNRFGVNDLLAINLVSLPPLILLLRFLLQKRAQALVLAAGGWFVLLNLPALIYLNSDYVINSPRLLYPSGAAIAWLWAAAVSYFVLPAQPGAAGGASVGRLQGALVALFVAALLFQNIGFVRTIMRHYHLAERPVHQLTAVARQHPSEQELLLVNFPSWLTPGRASFALGNHGAQILPFYISVQELIYAHNGVDQPARSVQFTNIRQPQPYYHGLLGEEVDYDGLRRYLSASAGAYVTQWTAEEINLVWAGAVTERVLSQPIALFEDAVALEVVAIHDQGRTVEAVLDWQLRQKINQDFTVFMHLYGPDGQLLSQADGYPLLGLAPFWLWDVGQTLQEQRVLSWPEGAPPGIYRIGVGVYDAASGERLSANQSNGEHWPDDTAMILVLQRR
jgi:hypothetical protein